MQKKLLFLASALLGFLLAMGGMAVWKGLPSLKLPLPWAQDHLPSGSAPVSAKPVTERVNVLLLGTDANRFDGNTDLMMVVSLDPARKTIHLLSIPRDTRVRIPGHGLEKINAASFLGGPELAVRTVEELLDTSIDYWVITTFKGAARIIDRLGGVTVTIPRRMDYDDPYQNLHIHLKPGRQHLNGEKAIQFARFRSYPMGDVTRTQQQQYLLREMFSQLLSSVTPGRIPALVPELIRYVRTNATLDDALRLASLFRDREGWRFETMTLPGNFWDENGVSYWRVDPVKARKAWRDFLEGRPSPLLDPSLAQPGRREKKKETVEEMVYGEGRAGEETVTEKAYGAAEDRQPAPGPPPGPSAGSETPGGQEIQESPGISSGLVNESQISPGDAAYGPGDAAYGIPPYGAETEESPLLLEP